MGKPENEKIYTIQTCDKGFQIHCRVRKNTLICKSHCGYLWLKVSRSVDDILILEECRIQTKWVYTLVFSESFAEWIQSVLEPCWLMAFYCYPSAFEIELPYVWTLEYNRLGGQVAWSLGSERIPCTSLGSFQGDIVDMDAEVAEGFNWYCQACEPSEDNVVLTYV